MSCKQTCSRFREAVTTSVELQVLIERTVPHAATFGDLRLSPYDQMCMLQLREAHWTALSPTLSYAFAIQSELAVLFTVHAGTIMSLHDSQMESPDPESKDSAVLNIRELPQEPPFKMQMRTTWLAGVNASRVIMCRTDALQHLAVLVIYDGELDPWDNASLRAEDFKLLALSTINGQAHHLARDPIISLRHLALHELPWVDHQPPRNEIVVHLRGSFVMIYPRDPASVSHRNIDVFDWQTGNSAYYPVDEDSHEPYDATFVSDSRILMYNLSSIALQVISVDDVCFEHGSPLPLQACFYLPSLKSSFGYTRSRMSWRPALGAAGDGVAVAVVKISNDLSTSILSFDLVIQIAPLLAAASPGINSVMTTPDGVYHYLWFEWGPWFARFFEAQVCDSVWHSISGFRVARSVPIYVGEEEIHSMTSVQIYDFNPLSVGRDLVMDTDDESDDSSINTSAFIADGTSVATANSSRAFPSPLAVTFDEIQEQDDTIADLFMRTRRHPPVTNIPDVGRPYTRIVTDVFARGKSRSPFNEVVYCAMPYRVTARTYKETFSIVLLDEASMVTLMVWESESGDQEAEGKVYAM